ncbi:hypothetical protein [Roseibium sp. MMSF_3412]|uniref:hypothetical protein n=1 Tax=Roseibium sp. MMSF_3412 TaxID=3046712 RepID=UPI00273E3A0F|nr:hypothetical protein [Roseibium sp. MMSF_3412]
MLLTSWFATREAALGFVYWNEISKPTICLLLRDLDTAICCIEIALRIASTICVGDSAGTLSLYREYSEAILSRLFLASRRCSMTFRRSLASALTVVEASSVGMRWDSIRMTDLDS